MKVSDEDQRAIKNLVTKKLQDAVKDKSWPLPHTVTTVPIDMDSYQAVVGRTRDKWTDRPGFAAPVSVRSQRLCVVGCDLHVVCHERTLKPEEFDTLRSGLSGPTNVPTTGPAADLCKLADHARRTQLQDVLQEYLSADGGQVCGDPYAALNSQSFTGSLQRVPRDVPLTLVTLVPLTTSTAKAISAKPSVTHVACPTHGRVALMSSSDPVELGAILLAGRSPLAVRYLAYDVGVTIDGLDNGTVRVRLEERRGLHVLEDTRAVLFLDG